MQLHAFAVEDELIRCLRRRARSSFRRSGPCQPKLARSIPTHTKLHSIISHGAVADPACCLPPELLFVSWTVAWTLHWRCLVVRAVEATSCLQVHHGSSAHLRRGATFCLAFHGAADQSTVWCMDKVWFA